MFLRLQICFLLFGMALGGTVGAERYFADYYYVPPPAPKTSLRTGSVPLKNDVLPAPVVRSWLETSMPALVLEDFREDAPVVKALADAAPAHQVAFGIDLALDAAHIFSGPVSVETGGYVFLAAVTSLDARALRLRVDLSDLAEDEVLYVLDAEGRAAFGAYTVAQAGPNGVWLPTTLNDTVALALCSPRPDCPKIRLETVSHFFKSIFTLGTDAPLPCNIPIAEETQPDAVAVASGVGMLIIPYGSGQAFCSGALLTTQSPASLPPEPYVFSAWHCFDASVDFAGVEVFWDYRSESDDPNLLARNQGSELIGYNGTLDAVLIKLTGPVDVGPFGRAWLGWDTQRPETDDLVQTIHYPRACSMKTSRGNVVKGAADICLNSTCTAVYEEQVEVLWSEGVTEQGSSGSPLLNRDLNYRVIGSLSNGPAHSCTNTSGNYDHYSSFSLFFEQVKCHLVSGLECGTPYEPKHEDVCLICRIFGKQTSTVDNLRRFRDQVLSRSQWGKTLIREYYALGPELGDWFERDPLAKAAFKSVAWLGSAWGAALK